MGPSSVVEVGTFQAEPSWEALFAVVACGNQNIKSYFPLGKKKSVLAPCWEFTLISLQCS